VNGTLDDPKFRLGAVIWKVFVNILEKAVTAPFALLGSLFGGGPDLQFIDFLPGASGLDSAATDKTRGIVKALTERPQLKIEVPIAEVDELDRPALIEAQFSAQLREAQSAKSGAETLDPTAKVALLTKVYVKTLGSEPKYPDEITNIKAKPDLAAAKVDFLSKALHEHIAVAAADLTALGQQRAVVIQQALLTDSQVGADRVFLVVSDKAKNQDGRVRLELSLK
jgi:hypothetical protein